MFEYLIQPIKEKLENLLKIGSYTNVNGSDGKLQEIQIKTLRNIEDALRVSQFGFNSKAPNGSKCIVAKIGNEKIVIANEHIASIIDVASGDSIQYNENGDYVKVEKDKITIKAKDLIINADDTTINGNLKATGNIDADGNIDAVGSVKGTLVTDKSTNVTLSTHLTASFGTPPTPGT